MTSCLRSRWRFASALAMKLSALAALNSGWPDDDDAGATESPNVAPPPSIDTDAGIIDASFDAADDAKSSSDASSATDAGNTPPPLVRGLAIQNIAMFQAVKVFLVNQGVAVAKTNAPIVAGRPGR